MKYLKRVVVLAFSLFLLFNNNCFAQFTADMVQTENGVTETNKFYSENPFYRMDIKEDGEENYVVVNRNTGITTVVIPSEKMYMEMSSSGMRSMANDVFQSIEAQKEKYETNHLGTETISGYDCEKYQVIIDGNPVSTYWQSPSLEFPIKVISGTDSNMIMELKNIVEGDVDDSVFIIPDSYTKMEMPGMH